MAKATVRTKGGSSVLIEGEADEVARIVRQIDADTQIGIAKRMVMDEKRAAKEEKKTRTAKDLVVSLKEEGFFRRPRRLADVTTKLEETGYLYPVTTLSGVVLALVQQKILTRTRKEGVWVYGTR